VTLATGMEFGLLGPLTVRCGGTALAVPQGRQRAALAALLLRGNRAVPTDDLAEALWGADLPPSARVSVQNYVMQLRSTLGPAGCAMSWAANSGGAFPSPSFPALAGRPAQLIGGRRP
jgi:DNA-binding SARP family transcriptional activator